MNTYPKKIRIKLDKEDYHQLRMAAYKRAEFHCEVCKKWCFFEEGTIHHIKTVGAGGDDSLENSMWCHKLCHPD